MPLFVKVPPSVMDNAQQGLDAHAQGPDVEDVTGLSTARQLLQGLCPPDLIPRIHAFFNATEAAAGLEQNSLLKDERTSGILRSYLLYGGETGAAWAAAEYRRLVAAGTVDADPSATLFECPPEDVYTRFSAGAWRYEYGLDTPAKAARFVEAYAKGTGRALHLDRAFGRSSASVANALHRRMGSDPWTSVYRHLRVDDGPHKLAAERDLATTLDALDGPLGESLNPTMFKSSSNPIFQGKINFPILLAYCILAVEDPEGLKQYNQGKKLLPAFGTKPASYSTYDDVQNILIMYFHPQGARYKDPDDDKDFDGVDTGVQTVYTMARYGHTLTQTSVIKALGRARQWLAKNKLLSGASSTLISAWRKGDWQSIFDELSLDADIRPYFQNLLAKNPQPKDGVKLQQVKAADDVVKKYFDGLMGEPADPINVPLADTAFGKACAAAGTPVGINSVLFHAGTSLTVLGAYEIAKPASDLGVQIVMDGGTSPLLKGVNAYSDTFLASKVASGQATVLQGHKDLPGTAYANAPNPQKAAGNAPPPPVDTVSPDAWDDDEVKAAAEAEVGPVTLAGSNLFASGKFAAKTFGASIKVGTQLSTDSLPKGTVVGCFKDGDGEYLYVIRNEEDKTFIVAHDEIIEDGLKKGLMWLTSLGPKLEKQELYATAAEYFADQFSDTAHQWQPYKIDHTAASFALSKKYGGKVEILPGTQLKQGENVFTFEAAFLNPYNQQTLLVYKVPGGKFNEVKDEVLADAIKAGKAVPVTAPPVVAPAAVIPPAPPKPPTPPPKFVMGDLLSVPGDVANYVVVSVLSAGGGAVPQYLLNWLSPTGDAQVSCQTTNVSNVDGVAKKLTSVPSFAAGLEPEIFLGKYVRVGDGYTATEVPDNLSIACGDILQIGGEYVRFIRAAEKDGVVYPVIAKLKPVNFYGFVKDCWHIQYGPPSAFPTPEAVEPTVYAPDDPPIAGEEDAMASDPEPAVDTVSPPSPSMTGGFVGTQAALDFAKSKGWILAIKAAAPGFQWELGDVLQYGMAERTIIGYALQGFGGTPCYITQTGLGNVSYKQTANGNTSYGPKLKTDGKVVAALLTGAAAVAQGLSVAGGTAVPATPKLKKPNYSLSPEAIALGKLVSVVFEDEKPGQPFHANTKLTNALGEHFKLLGFWTDPGDKKYKGVLWDLKSQQAVYVTTTSLGYVYSIQYTHKNVVDAKDGVTFGKDAGSPSLQMYDVLTASVYPTSPAAGWDTPPAIKQPLFDQVKIGQHVSAGVVCVIPPGVKVDGVTFDDAPMLVMTHPMNEFGGYTLTFPKGTVEPDEAAEKAAVREVLEETGLSCKPIAHLGDFASGGSVTRMFIGYATGGDPKAAGSESDAVTLKPFAYANGLYANSSWYLELTSRDRSIADAAAAWLKKNGFPHEVVPDEAPAYSKVAFKPAAGEPVAKYPPAQQYKMDAGEVDYDIPAAVDQSIKDLMKSTHVMYQGWKYTPQGQIVAEGYPKVGDVFEYYGTETICVAYVVRSSGAGHTALQTLTLIMKDPSLASEAGGGLGGVNLYTISWNGVKNTLAPPIDFTTLTEDPPAADPDGPSDAAATSGEDVWSTLATAAFPVSPKILNLLKLYVTQAFAASPDTIATFTASAPPAPKAGDVYTVLPGSSTLVCAGYVTFGWPDQQHTVIVGLNAYAEVSIYQFTSAADFPVNAELTAATKSPYAFYAHPNAIANKLIQQIATTPDSITYTFSEVATWMGEAGVPYATAITAEVIPLVAKCFVPGMLSGTEHQMILEYLQDKAAAVAAGDVDTVSPVDDLDAGFDLPVPAPKPPTVGTPDAKKSLYLVTGNDQLSPGKTFNQEFPNGVLVWAVTSAEAEVMATGDGPPSAVIATLQPFPEASKGPLTAATATPEDKSAFVKKMQAGIAKKKQMVKDGLLPPEALTPKKSKAVKPPAGYVQVPPVQPASDPYVHALTSLDPAAFTQVKKITGTGGNNNHYYELAGPNGTKWFGKVAKDGNPARAYASAAAYKVMAACGIDAALPTGVIVKDGETISIQPLIDGDGVVPQVVPDDLKVTVLRQHAVDMFIGDHDGNPGNWLKKGGKLVPIDREQAFKFYAAGTEVSLNPFESPAGNVGEPIAKRLLKDWSKETATIPPQAFAVMRGTILAIQKLGDQQIADWLAGYFENGKGLAVAKAKILKRIYLARDNYLKDWTTVLESIKPGFKWPGTTALPGLPIDTAPAAFGFSEVHEKLIADAVKSGWQGMTLPIDGPNVEDQEVMVKQVAYLASGQSTPTVATLIHFRLTRSAGFEAEAAIGKQSKGVYVSDAGGPTTLPIDIYWDTLLASIKHVYHHVGYPGGAQAPVFDAVFKPERVDPIKMMKVDLTALKTKADANLSGTYGLGKGAIPNSVVSAMATQYLDYVSTILYTVDHAAEVVAKNQTHPDPPENISQFMWTPQTDKTKGAVEDAASDTYLKITIPTNKSAFSPASKIGGVTAMGKGEPAMVQINDYTKTNPDAPIFDTQYGGSGYKLKVPQYRIEVPSVPGARMYFIPTDHEKYESQGTHTHAKGKKGLAYTGQVWGIVPGEATPAQVSLLLKAFEDASGISMRPATPADDEVLYLSKQAYCLQATGGAKMTPTGEGEGLKSPEYKAAMDKYAVGDKQGARTALRQFIANQINKSGIGEQAMTVTAATLEKLPNFGVHQYTTHSYAGGEQRRAGHRRQLRLGWTREKLASYLGDYYVTHSITKGDLAAFMDTVTKSNGCLVATADRPFYGVPVGGSSPSQDVMTGGASGVYTSAEKGVGKSSNTLYFDISILLRTDVYLLGSDNYGTILNPRGLTPEAWKAMSMHYEFVFKHEIDLRQYLHSAYVYGSGQVPVASIIKMVKDRWGSDVRFALGRTPEQVFQTTH